MRGCGWCGVDLSHKSVHAQYCCIQHKKNAAATRFRERSPGYYTRYSRSAARLIYNEINKEARRTYAREYSREHRGDLGRVQREQVWWAANRQRKYEYNRKRRALRRGAESVGLAPRDWHRLLVRYGHRCAYCSETLTKATIDHVIPLNRGGRHAIGNIVPACRRCNSSKCDSYVVEWRRRGMFPAPPRGVSQEV